MTMQQGPLDERGAVFKAMANDLKARANDTCACKGGAGAPPTDYNALATQQVNDNKCRAFTTLTDAIFLLTDNIKQCQGDLQHEMIHVMSGTGGKTPFSGGDGNTFNEAVTQYFTEEAFPGGPPAYTSGDAGKWLSCMKKLGGSLEDQICEAYFKGNTASLVDALLTKYKQNKPTFTEKRKTDDELKQMLDAKLKGGDINFEKKLCNTSSAGEHPDWTPAAPPPPPPT